MQPDGIEKEEIQPALLTRSEIDWLLLGNKQISKLYERKIRHSIKKKIEALIELNRKIRQQKSKTRVCHYSRRKYITICRGRSEKVPPCNN